MIKIQIILNDIGNARPKISLNSKYILYRINSFLFQQKPLIKRTHK